MLLEQDFLRDKYEVHKTEEFNSLEKGKGNRSHRHVIYLTIQSCFFYLCQYYLDRSLFACVMVSILLPHVLNILSFETRCLCVSFLDFNQRVQHKCEFLPCRCSDYFTHPSHFSDEFLPCSDSTNHFLPASKIK